MFKPFPEEFGEIFFRDPLNSRGGLIVSSAQKDANDAK